MGVNKWWKMVSKSCLLMDFLEFEPYFQERHRESHWVGHKAVLFIRLDFLHS